MRKMRWWDLNPQVNGGGFWVHWFDQFLHTKPTSWFADTESRFDLVGPRIKSISSWSVFFRHYGGAGPGLGSDLCLHGMLPFDLSQSSRAPGAIGVEPLSLVLDPRILSIELGPSPLPHQVIQISLFEPSSDPATSKRMTSGLTSWSFTN